MQDSDNDRKVVERLRAEHIALSTFAAYQQNNWLLGKWVPYILDSKPTSLLEVGCGNGRFLAAVSPLIPVTDGVDFVRNPALEKHLVQAPNVSVTITDIQTFAPNQVYDVVVSADVFEHFPTEHILQYISAIDRLGARQVHRVACYGAPGHHTVLPVTAWLNLFQQVNNAYAIVDIERRPGKARGEVVTIERR
jgi:trans-aconitate methyltransferase